jgi:hypothetical protein
MPRSRILPFKKPTVGQIISGQHRLHPRYKGCVGHWIMVEGGGLTAFDASGYNNHGTLQGGPTWQTGQFGSTLRFDGSGDYIDMPENSSLDLTKLSIVAVLYPFTLDTGDFRIVVAKGIRNATTLNYQLDFRDGSSNGNARVFFTWHNGGFRDFKTSSQSAVRTGEWFHVAIVSNQSTEVREIYVNGVSLAVLDNTGGTSLPLNNEIFQIGQRQGGATNEHLHADVDELRVYNRELSPLEVQSLYARPFLEFEETHRRVYAFVPTAPGVGFDIFQRARMDGLGGRKSKDMSGL